MINDTVIKVKDLHVYFYTNQRCNKVLNGVSFDIKKGKTLCIVGESGCGKSVTANTILQLLPELSRIENGSIEYQKEDQSIRIDQPVMGINCRIDFPKVVFPQPDSPTMPSVSPR